MDRPTEIERSVQGGVSKIRIMVKHQKNRLIVCEKGSFLFQRKSQNNEELNLVDPVFEVEGNDLVKTKCGNYSGVSALSNERTLATLQRNPTS